MPHPNPPCPWLQASLSIHASRVPFQLMCAERSRNSSGGGSSSRTDEIDLARQGGPGRTEDRSIPMSSMSHGEQHWRGQTGCRTKEAESTIPGSCHRRACCRRDATIDSDFPTGRLAGEVMIQEARQNIPLGPDRMGLVVVAPRLTLLGRQTLAWRATSDGSIWQKSWALVKIRRVAQCIPWEQRSSRQQKGKGADVAGRQGVLPLPVCKTLW